MSLAADSGPSPRQSPSPDRRFANKLKPTKSKQSDPDSSTGSLALLTPTVSEQSGLRKSIDKGITSLKEKTRRDSDAKGQKQTGSDSRRRLSRLVPKRSRKKLRGGDNDSESEYSVGAADEGLGRLGVRESGSKLNLPPSNNASSDSFGKSAASSLLTEESDSER